MFLDFPVKTEEPPQKSDHGDDADDEYEKSLSETAKTFIDTGNANTADAPSDPIEVHSSDINTSSNPDETPTHQEKKGDIAVTKPQLENVSVSQDNEESKERTENDEETTESAKQTKSKVTEVQTQSVDTVGHDKRKKLSIGQKTIKAAKIATEATEANKRKALKSPEQESDDEHVFEEIKYEETPPTMKLRDDETSDKPEEKGKTNMLTGETTKHTSSLKQKVTVMAKVLRALSSSDKNGNESESKPPSAKAADIPQAIAEVKSSQSHSEKETTKQSAHSETPEPRHQSTKSTQPSSSDTLSSANKSRADSSTADLSRHGRLLKSRSLVKVSEREGHDRASVEPYSKESKYEASRRSTRGSYYNKQRDSSSSESESRRAYSKSFSTSHKPNPQHLVRKKLRQSLEGRPLNREDSGLRSITKPIHAFRDDSECQ